MKLRIPLPPAGFERPRPGRSGGFYSPHKPALDDWSALIKNAMRVGGHSIIEGPVSVDIHTAAKFTVVEVNPIVGEQPARPKGIKRDLDNITKFVNDALEKYAYYNDSQIVALSHRFITDETASHRR